MLDERVGPGGGLGRGLGGSLDRGVRPTILHCCIKTDTFQGMLFCMVDE